MASICQWPRIHPASWAAGEADGLDGVGQGEPGGDGGGLQGAVLFAAVPAAALPRWHGGVPRTDLPSTASARRSRWPCPGHWSRPASRPASQAPTASPNVSADESRSPR
jgi:hypothetical protein